MSIFGKIMGAIFGSKADAAPAAGGGVAGGAAGDLLGVLGALHHPEGLDVLEPARQPHQPAFAARRAATSAGRRSPAALSSTPLTNLWPSVPP